MGYLNALLSDIVTKVTRRLNVNLSITVLQDDTKEEITTSGKQHDEIVKIRIPDHEGVPDPPLENAQSMDMADAHGGLPDFDRQIKIKPNYSTRSSFYVPVTNKQGKELGAIKVFDKKTGAPLTDEEKKVLNKLSGEIAKVMDKSNRWTSCIPGLGLVLGVVLLTTLLHGLLPGASGKVIGDVLMALFLGLLINNLFIIPIGMIPGIRFALRQMLRLAVILLGCRVAFTQIIAIGGKAVIIVTILILVALTISYLLGRIAKIPAKLAILIGVGTAVCGNTAIAAMAPVIDAQEEDFSFAVATNTLIGTVAVFVFPMIGHYLGFSDALFGTWVGTAVNDTSQVLATGFSFSQQAGEMATIIKLTRNAMMAFVLVAMGMIYAHATGSKAERKEMSLRERFNNSVPMFVLLFVIMAVLNTFGLFTWVSDLTDCNIHALIKKICKLLILGAMAGVGLGTNFSQMRKSGIRPFFVGVTTALTTAVLSLSLIYFLGPAGQ